MAADNDNWVSCKICLNKHELETQIFAAHFRILEDRLKALDKSIELRIGVVDQRFQATAEALTLREKIVDEKFHTVNKLREEVLTDRLVYFRKDTHDAYADELSRWRRSVDDRLNKGEARSWGINIVIGAIIVFAQVATAMAIIWFHPK